MTASSALVAELRARVAALEAAPRAAAGVLPFGVAALDAALPGGGLTLGALHEVAAPPGAEAHAAGATLFVAGVAARMGGPCLWVSPSRDLFAPGLALAGLTPDRLIVVEARTAKGVAALMEEGLRCPALGSVVGEVRGLALPQSRRLQLAAEASGVTAFALQRWAQVGCKEAGEAAPSVASTRWRVGSAASVPLSVQGVGRARLVVELLRCRGADGARFIMEAPDAQGRLALVSGLVHRPLAARMAA